MSPAGFARSGSVVSFLKGEFMNGRRRKIILAVAIVLILGSGGTLLWDYWAQNRSEKIYEELAAELSLIHI